jgi:heme-degrading monooxygenase HmoA
MAIRILIRRTIPEDKARQMIPLFKQMRQLALQQRGYISGETMRNYNNPEEFLVISSWQSVPDWENWLKSKERQDIQEKIDTLLGGRTRYDVFHYGFSE